MSESINDQLVSSFIKIHVNTEDIDNHMQTEFASVKKPVTTSNERLDKRLLIVERDMDTQIAVQSDLEVNLKETDLQWFIDLSTSRLNTRNSWRESTCIWTTYKRTYVK
jgi:hypothetical protein